jgi:hypothetical protein
MPISQIFTRSDCATHTSERPESGTYLTLTNMAEHSYWLFKMVYILLYDAKLAEAVTHFCSVETFLREMCSWQIMHSIILTMHWIFVTTAWYSLTEKDHLYTNKSVISIKLLNTAHFLFSSDIFMWLKNYATCTTTITTTTSNLLQVTEIM